MKRRFILAALGASVVVFGCAPERPVVKKPEPLPKVADRVLVLKRERKLFLMAGDRTLRTYDVSLGQTPVGHKQREGDSKTPEGIYTLDYRNPDRPVPPVDPHLVPVARGPGTGAQTRRLAGWRHHDPRPAERQRLDRCRSCGV